MDLLVPFDCDQLSSTELPEELLCPIARLDPEESPLLEEIPLEETPDESIHESAVSTSDSPRPSEWADPWLDE